MKNLFTASAILLALILSGTSFKKENSVNDTCSNNKDSMIVVMRIERKVKPEYVSLLKKSFDACKVEVMAKEPGCLNYTMFQSYNDSTIFCINEAWKTKADHNAHMTLDHTKKHLAEIKGINDPTFKASGNYTYWICPEANKK